VATAALHGSEYSPPIDRTSEERIYDGFLSDAERGAIRRWRTADWQQRAEIAFEDPRLVDFAARIIREAILDGRAGDLPQTLIDRVHARSRSAYERPYAGPDARWMTLARAAAKSRTIAGLSSPEGGSAPTRSTMRSRGRGRRRRRRCRSPRWHRRSTGRNRSSCRSKLPALPLAAGMTAHLGYDSAWIRQAFHACGI